jgi:hypothetical protein
MRAWAFGSLEQSVTAAGCRAVRPIRLAQPADDVLVFEGGDEFLRAHPAPGRDVRGGRGVVCEDRDRVPDRYVRDQLGELDHRQRAEHAAAVELRTHIPTSARIRRTKLGNTVAKRSTSS